MHRFRAEATRRCVPVRYAALAALLPVLMRPAPALAVARPASPLNRAASAATGITGYGAEPWLWFGNPVADAGAVVMSAHGTARFTVLSPSLLRLEYSPDGMWEDRRTLAVWNRAGTPPPFTTSTAGAVTTIDTGALLLTYTDDKSPFSPASLAVTRRTSAFWSNASATWTPADMPNADPGQLLGTFHTLDDVGGFPGLNCSTLDPNHDVDSAVAFFPCDFGLLSKGGFSLVDDSRTPVWDEAGSGWLVTQDKATCGDPAAGVGCFAGAAADTTDAGLCRAAGCCVAGPGPTLSLWYSAPRDDHFSDSLNCTEGCGTNGYVYQHAQGLVASEPGPGLVALNLYWNVAPNGTAAGAGGDNVASTFPPTQPGYVFARVEGYVFDPAAPQPAGTLPLKVWYSGVHLDHFTTAGPADEAEAEALGYALVGLAGYITPPPSGPAPPAPPFQCFRPGGHTDWYLFGHGADYDGALADWVALAGPVAVPRRSWLGVSWSKWNESSTDGGTRADVDALVAAGFPVDTYIFDMQWHLTPAWGGYAWDTGRYPDPPALLAWLHGLGLATGANFHDADGVQAGDNPATFPAMAAAMGLPPASSGVAFEIGNKTYADALQTLVMRPLIDGGIDQAWTDFQQGFPGVQAVSGLVPTAILNHYRFSNFSSAAGTRGTIHSRYAGRGDSRSTSSFGGDVIQAWDSLQFMVYFTATAANVAVCWWGHEMMRDGGGADDNDELFVRVNQFGAWSPIFTSWGNSGSNNNWWEMAAPYADALRGSLIDRNVLLPYRYTAAAAAAATGRCPVLPMYRTHPSEPDAYAAPGQYMFGPSIVVAPATAPVTAGDPAANGTVAVPVWLPPGGPWYAFATPGAPALPSGAWAAVNATLSDVPAFVRAGAVIPQLPRALAALPGAAGRQYSSLVFAVYPPSAPPGAASGGADVYEDDGLSTGYLAGESAVTTFSYAPATSGPGCTVYTIATAGSYAGMVTANRTYAVFLLASPPPVAADVNGTALPQSPSDGVVGTWFRTAGGDTRAYLPPVSTDEVPGLRVCV